MLISLFEKGEVREGPSSVSKAYIFLVLLPALAALSEMLRAGTDHMAHHALITCLSGNDQ